MTACRLFCPRPNGRHGPAKTEATADELRGMLKPLPPEQLQIWPVDKRGGNVTNEGAELIEPSSLSG